MMKSSKLWSLFNVHGVVTLMGLTVAVGCGNEPQEEPATQASSVQGMVPWQDPSTIASAATSTSASTTASLKYYGGPVVANPRVVGVFWGANVDATVKSGIGGFYSAVTSSAYIDWLSEYNTNINTATGQKGTNQAIGHGSYVNGYTIKPTRTATALKDADIQAELQAQIAAGNLPVPDANTIYMTYFPPGVKISTGTMNSCVQGGFCAYHGTSVYKAKDFYYGVFPDFGAGTGCDVGCGPNPQMFNNLTSVSSHELIETITDPGIGLATVYGPPLGWYDSKNGEVGDICNAQQGEVAGYVVQQGWSNKASSCVVTSGITDFTLGLSLTDGSVTTSVTQGSYVLIPIPVLLTSGHTGSVTLSVSGLPTGVAATFFPATVATGQTSTLELSAASNAVAATVTVTLKGTLGTTSHSVPISVTVTKHK